MAETAWDETQNYELTKHKIKWPSSRLDKY